MRDGEEGQTLPLLMLIMVMAIFASAFVIDMGVLYRERGRAQAAADMAVLAAVQELPDSAAAVAAAIDVAEVNGFDDAAASVGVVVTVDSDGPATGVDGLNCANVGFCARVTITNDHEWMFASLLSLTTAMGIATSASAEKGREPREVVFAIDRSGSLASALAGILYEIQYFSNDPHLLPTPGLDRLSLVLFDNNDGGVDPDDEPEVLLPLSGSFGTGGTDFLTALSGVLPNTNSDIGTALWRSRELFGSPLAPGVRRALVLVSDGQASFGGQHSAGIVCGPSSAPDCARDAAEVFGSDGIPIYAVRVQGNATGQALMVELATLSGGSYVDAGSTCAAPPGSCEALRAQLTAIARSLGLQLTE